jgi:hypothetical protein
MLWFMLTMLMDPLVLSAALVPLAGLGALYAFVLRFCRGPALPRRAARWALIVSWLSLLVWVIGVLHAIAASTNSTAILGILETPAGVVAAVVVLPVAWAVSLVALSVVRLRSGEPPPASSLAVATAIVLLTGAGIVHYLHAARLQALARDTTSTDELRGLYDRARPPHDTAVLRELAGNTRTPADVLAALASDDDEDVRYIVARNPSTPPSVLERLYAEPHTRTSLAVNPSVPLSILTKLAGDPDSVVRYNLRFNRSLPPEMRDTIAKDSTTGGSAAAVPPRSDTPRPWLVVAPPHDWAWFRPCIAVYQDDAPIELWHPAGYRFDSREECESMRKQLVRREQSPGRQQSGRTWRCEASSPPLDLYSHARCAYRSTPP